MGLIPNQNLTLGIDHPEVTYWESTPQLPLAVNSTVIVLGVLTFALQLGLVLLFMLRCWTFDNRVQEALKHPDSFSKLSELPYFHSDISKHLISSAAPFMPAKSAEEEQYEKPTDYAPFIHWDLVQN
ncbi:unnamed protein product [Menidia menidia]|uniref:(Atlantic silverside) hypothetical protein n=1 Tax=Menidia menidia TaxID=238744 RepID=A0A8S4B7U2_9TELE|nr:unnamed protein product [Menidia menidia]